MSIRDKFAKSGLSTDFVDVDLLIDGVMETVKIEVREQTIDQQFDLLDRVRRADGEIDTKLLSIETVLITAYDPDTGELAFDPADRDMLRSKSSRAFQRLFRAANTAAGLETEDQVVSDLDDAPTVETSTS